MENTMEVPQKIKNRTAIWSSNSTSGCLPEENKNTNLKRYMHPYVPCRKIHNNQDMEANYVSIDRWMDKEDVVHIDTMEYYSATKKNEIMPFIIWMDLEGIILSEICQTNTIWFHLYVESKKTNKTRRNRFLDTENKLVVAREEGEGGWAKQVKGIKRHTLPVIK